MASTALAGKGGSVFLPGTPNVPIAQITQWQLQIDADNYETTVLGDNWKEFIPGLRGYSGSIQGFYNVPQDSTGQLQLYNALINGTQLALQLQTATGGGYFEGFMSITQCSVSDAVNAVVTIQFNFVGTGTLQHVP